MKLPEMKPAEWTSNLIALAALISSSYAIYVTRDMTRIQTEREESAKAMNYSVALRLDLPYRPTFIREFKPDRPDKPPYLVIPARIIFTNSSTLPQAFNDIHFGFEEEKFYPVLAVRNQAGSPISWPINIQPGTTTAMNVEIPFPVKDDQLAAIEARIKSTKAKIQTWQQFEELVLSGIRVGPDTLLTSLPRKTYFWIETFSPSPGSPRKVIFNDWVPNHWTSDRPKPELETKGN